MAMSFVFHQPQYSKGALPKPDFGVEHKFPKQNCPKMVRGKFVEMLFMRYFLNLVLPYVPLWNTQLSPDLLLNFSVERR